MTSTKYAGKMLPLLAQEHAKQDAVDATVKEIVGIHVHTPLLEFNKLERRAYKLGVAALKTEIKKRFGGME